jgi:hypothetical protein
MGYQGQKLSTASVPGHCSFYHASRTSWRLPSRVPNLYLKPWKEEPVNNQSQQVTIERTSFPSWAKYEYTVIHGLVEPAAAVHPAKETTTTLYTHITSTFTTCKARIWITDQIHRSLYTLHGGYWENGSKWRPAGAWGHPTIFRGPSFSMPVGHLVPGLYRMIFVYQQFHLLLEGPYIIQLSIII